MELETVQEKEVYFFKVKNQSKNHSQRRLVKNEIKRLIPKLQKIEDSFLFDLFNSNIIASYKEIYNLHLEWWNKEVNWMKRTNRIKYTNLNEYYFEDLYKPIE